MIEFYRKPFILSYKTNNFPIEFGKEKAFDLKIEF
jgi:hypothetical protein